MAESEKVPIYGSFKEAVHAFIQMRLQAKLEKLDNDDPKRQELLGQHVAEVWLEDAARRVQQIQAVTHSLKPIHPDARGTNLYVEPTQLAPLQEVGSHALGREFASDVVGNAAALDVYKLLKLEVGSQTLLAALLANDAGALQALHEDAEQAKALRDAFVSITAARAGGPSSHARAKQLFWLEGDDATDDAQFALLAPLYATSLAHAVYAEIQEHRFGEANKAARTARRERKPHDGVFCDYPDLAVQKMGGTKPQNISQLNSERGGVNYLLSSMPPLAWVSSNVQMPMNTTSVFERIFGARPQVYRTLGKLQDFLASNPQKNKATRDRFKELIEVLTQEVVIFAASYHQTLPPGWTDDPENKYSLLNKYQQLWLDPMRASLDDTRPFMKKPSSNQSGKEQLREEMMSFAEAWQWTDWPAEIMKTFARWLTNELGKGFGDPHTRQWRKELLASNLLKNQLRELREILKAPHYIPIRHTHDELVAARGASA